MKEIITIFVLAALVPVWLSANATDLFMVEVVCVLLAVACFVLFVACAFRKVFSGKIRLLGLSMILCLCVNASVILSAWPLRLRFDLSKGSLERVASLAKNGQQMTGSMRVGLFNIKRVEIVNESVCLWTQTSGNMEGFVNAGANEIKGINIWSTLRLSDDWQYLWED